MSEYLSREDVRRAVLHNEGDAVIAAIDELETVELPEWIPVSERLPDFNEEVLIYAIGIEDGFSPVVAISETYIFQVLPISNGTIEWRDPWDFFSKNYEVTHWMPLPQPPEVKE